MKIELALLGFSLAAAVAAGCGETTSGAPGDAGDAGADQSTAKKTDSAVPPAQPGCGPGRATPTCPASQECCFDTSATGTGTSSCVPQGSCTGSVLACQGSADCPSGQLCCFDFADAGAAGAGGGPFSTACASDCATDAGGYQLCAMSSECPSGVMCTMGIYTTYCMQMQPFTGGFPFGDGGGFPFGDGGFPGFPFGDAGSPSGDAGATGDGSSPVDAGHTTD